MNSPMQNRRIIWMQHTTPKNNELAGYIWVQVKVKNTHKGGGLPKRFI